MNKAILIGNLGKDPELSYTQNGKAVCRFSIATTARWKGEDGEKKERTDWHNIVAWGRTAEVCGQYLRKGSKVCVTGAIQTRSWDDKNSGVKKYITEIVIDEMEMLSSKNKPNDESAPQEQTASDSPDKEDLPF